MSLSEDDLGLLCAGYSAILGFEVVPPRSLLTLESATAQPQRSVLPKIGVHDLFHTTYLTHQSLLNQPLTSLSRSVLESLNDVLDISVKIINGETINIQAEKGQTVGEVKSLIQQKLAQPFDDLTLTSGGLPMRDSEPVDQYTAFTSVPATNSFKPIIYCAGGGSGPYELDCSELDPRFNYDFTNEKDDGKEYVRGGKVYNRPYGWKRFAVKVLDDERYNKDNTWLGEDGIRTNESQGEWPVAYHGTGSHGKDAVTSIIDQGYKIGTGAMYGPGIYTSPIIKWYDDENNSYTAKFVYKDKKWMIILQNRVNPSPGHLKIQEKTWAGVPFWISPLQDVEKKVYDVRPYGILFKKV